MGNASESDSGYARPTVEDYGDLVGLTSATVSGTVITIGGTTAVVLS